MQYPYICAIIQLLYVGSVSFEILLDISETQNNKNVVIKCTNTSDDPVEFPQVSILFFKGDTLVEYDMGYLLPDSDDELKPGKSKSIELECYEDFDRYETFYTAR